VTLIRLEGISVAFGDRVVLSELSLEVPVIGSTAVMGPSGSGKSTLLGVLAGRQKLAAGQRRELVTPLRVAWVFQTAPVLAERRALDNVAIGALATGVAPTVAYEDAAAALRTLGLEASAHQRAKRLSGGERQRVAIARAMVADCDLVLADEPSASLDETNRDLVGHALVVASRTKAVVVATHDPDLATMFDRILRLHHGQTDETHDETDDRATTS
jgi:ABC-type lipoprotein export system ATPase subunit